MSISKKKSVKIETGWMLSVHHFFLMGTILNNSVNVDTQLKLNSINLIPPLSLLFTFYSLPFFSACLTLLCLFFCLLKLSTLCQLSDE